MLLLFNCQTEYGRSNYSQSVLFQHTTLHVMNGSSCVPTDSVSLNILCATMMMTVAMALMSLQNAVSTDLELNSKYFVLNSTC